MDIFYSKDTLYVDLKDELSLDLVRSVKKRVFSIIDDYAIDNIVLHIISDNQNEHLLDTLVDDYREKYGGNIKIC